MSTPHDTSDPVLDALGYITDPSLRQGVIALFDEAKRAVAEDGVTLVVLCARRLPCLYQVLLAAGYPPIEGATVVSDRFLDLVEHEPEDSQVDAELSWHQWRKVLVLDDSVVLGTVLTELHRRVLAKVEAVGGTVRCAVVCVDAERKAGFLTSRLGLDGCRELPTADRQRFSTDIVTTLYRNGVPLFSDFPVSRRVRMSIADLRELVATSGWYAAEVTAPVVASPLQVAYTLIPDKERTRAALARMPGPVAALVEGMKVRIFVSRGHHDDREARVTLVPIALLGACDQDQIHDALDATLDVAPDDGTGDRLPVMLALADAPAQHRLVQLLASVSVLAELAETAPAIDRHWDEHWQEPTHHALSFGPLAVLMEGLVGSTWSVGRRMDDATAQKQGLELRPPPLPAPSVLLDDDELRMVLADQQALLREPGVGVDEPPGPGQMTRLGVVAAHALSSVFGFANRFFELPQQDEIRALDGYQAYVELFGAEPNRRVLNHAVTQAQLTSALLGTRAVITAWQRAVISLGVDIGNDMGVIVPATRCADTGLVHRAYRMGETAGLADMPLPLWRSDEHDRLDAFVSSIDDGYPLLSGNVPISLDWSQPDLDARAELADLRRQALPGDTVSVFDGTVTEVDADTDTFYADVVDRATYDFAVAQLSLAQVSSSHQDRVRPGATFVWTIFERQRVDYKDRTSRVWMDALPVFDEDDIERTVRELSFLDA